MGVGVDIPPEVLYKNIPAHVQKVGQRKSWVMDSEPSEFLPPQLKHASQAKKVFTKEPLFVKKYKDELAKYVALEKQRPLDEAERRMKAIMESGVALGSDALGHYGGGTGKANIVNLIAQNDPKTYIHELGHSAWMGSEGAKPDISDKSKANWRLNYPGTFWDQVYENDPDHGFAAALASWMLRQPYHDVPNYQTGQYETVPSYDPAPEASDWFKRYFGGNWRVNPTGPKTKVVPKAYGKSLVPPR